MRYFTPSLLVAVLVPLAVSAAPARRDTDLAPLVFYFPPTSAAGNATGTSLSPSPSQDSGLNVRVDVIDNAHPLPSENYPLLPRAGGPENGPRGFWSTFKDTADDTFDIVENAARHD